MIYFDTYALIDSRTGLPFYIGVTFEGSTRPSDHIKWAKDGYDCNNEFRGNEIRKLLNLGLEIPIQIVFQAETRREVLQEEVRLIALYGRRDLGTGILTNLTDGGEGLYGLSNITKRKMSISGSNRPPLSIEQRKKRSILFKGRVLSTECKEKIGNANRGKVRTEEQNKAQSEASKGISKGPCSDERRKNISLAKGGDGKIWTLEEAREECSKRRVSWTEAKVTFSLRVAKILWEEGILTYEGKYPDGIATKEVRQRLDLLPIPTNNRYSEETKKKISLSLQGIARALATRQQISLTKRRGIKTETLEEAIEECKKERISYARAKTLFGNILVEILWDKGLLTYFKKYPHEMNDEERKKAGL